MKYRDGFIKWLCSTKFQIAVLAILLVYLAQGQFDLEAVTAAKVIRDIAVAYMGARILEPLVEAMVVRTKEKRGE